MAAENWRVRLSLADVEDLNDSFHSGATGRDSSPESEVDSGKERVHDQQRVQFAVEDTSRLIEYALHWGVLALSLTMFAISVLITLKAMSQVASYDLQFYNMQTRLREIENRLETEQSSVDLAQLGLGAWVVPKGTSESYTDWTDTLKGIVWPRGSNAADAAMLVSPSKMAATECWPIASQATIEIELGRPSYVDYVEVVTGTYQAKIIVSAVLARNKTSSDFVDVGLGTATPLDSESPGKAAIGKAWRHRPMKRVRIHISSEGKSDCIKYLRIMSVGGVSE